MVEKLLEMSHLNFLNFDIFHLVKLMESNQLPGNTVWPQVEWDIFSVIF